MSLLEGKNLKKAVCLFALFFMFVLAASFFGLMRKASRNRIIDFNDGWRITCRDSVLRDTNLQEFRAPSDLRRGDFITLYNRLPTGMEDGSALVLPVQLSTISVDIGGDLVYGYGSKEFSVGDMVGSAVHIIRIPDHSQGLPVTIVLRAGEDQAFYFFDGITLDKTTWGFPDYMNDNLSAVIISISLVVTGLIFIVMTIFLAFREHEWLKIDQTGMLCFTVGCWHLCETNAVQMFSMDFWWNTMLRYLFATLSIIPMIRIISNEHNDQGIRKHLENAIFYLNQLLIYASFILSLMGTIHLCNLRFFFQAEGMISILAVLLIEWVGRDTDVWKESGFRESLAGLAFVTADAIRYVLYVNLKVGSGFLRNSFIPYGALFLVMMMTGSYVFELYCSYVRKSEEKTLKKLAYTDGLTGLLNRAFCKDRMAELDNGNRSYYMISFDVNGLKEINDSKGHLMGDRLLITFAGILEKCFSDVGNVIRPGGDEFLVISDDAAAQELQGRLGWLEGFERNAERSLGIPVSSSYGMAGSNEVPGHTTEEVYNLADRRMYEMKVREGK